MLVNATKEVQRIASNDGLLLAAGGEGGLTEGHGRLVIDSRGIVHNTTLFTVYSYSYKIKLPQRKAWAIEIPWWERKRMERDSVPWSTGWLLKTPQLSLNMI